jgi:hypothetical protein
MFPAEPLAERIAQRDTVILLTESISTMAGERIDHIPVHKGEVVLVGIASYQRFNISRSFYRMFITSVLGTSPVGVRTQTNSIRFGGWTEELSRVKRLDPMRICTLLQ